MALKDTILALLQERAATKGVTRAEGDEGSFEFESSEGLTKALLNLSKLDERECKGRLSRPLVTRMTDPPQC